MLSHLLRIKNKVGSLFRKNASRKTELSGFGKGNLHLRKNDKGMLETLTNKVRNSNGEFEETEYCRYFIMWTVT